MLFISIISQFENILVLKKKSLKKHRHLMAQNSNIFKDVIYWLLISGIIGITLDISWPEPATESPEDRAASEMSLQFYVSTKFFFKLFITKKKAS